MWQTIVDNFQYVTNIDMLNGVCEECGDFLGNHSYLTIENNSDSNVVIGDKKYKCICNKCYLNNV